MRRLLLFLLFCSPVGAQTFTTFFAANTCSSNPSTCSATINTGTIGSGQLITLTVNIYGGTLANTQQTVVISDDAGSTYTESPDGPLDNTGGASDHYRTRMYYTCSSGGGGGTKITVGYASAQAQFLMIVGAEYSYSGTCTLSQHSTGQNTSTSTVLTTANITTTAATELLVSGAGQYNGSTWTAGGDGQSGTYTIRSQNNFIAIEDIKETVTNAYSASWTLSGGTSNGFLLAFSFPSGTQTGTVLAGPAKMAGPAVRHL